MTKRGAWALAVVLAGISAAQGDDNECQPAERGVALAEARAAGYPEIAGTEAARFAEEAAEAGLPIARADHAFLFLEDGRPNVVWLDGDGDLVIRCGWEAETGTRVGGVIERWTLRAKPRSP